MFRKLINAYRTHRQLMLNLEKIREEFYADDDTRALLASMEARRVELRGGTP